MEKTVIALIALLLITGCGSKTKDLSCTNGKDDSHKVVLHFDKKGDKLLSYEQIMSVSFEDQGISDEDMEEAIKDAKAECSEYSNLYKGISCDIKNGKRDITMTLTFDLENIDDAGIKAFYIDEIQDMNYDEFKTYMSENNFTCK